MISWHQWDPASFVLNSLFIGKSVPLGLREAVRGSCGQDDVETSFVNDLLW